MEFCSFRLLSRGVTLDSVMVLSVGLLIFLKKIKGDHIVPSATQIVWLDMPFGTLGKYLS